MKKFLLVVLFVLTMLNYYSSTNKVESFFDTYEDNYIRIEKINLKQDILSYKDNTVDDGIIYLKESNFDNNFYIIAAHSGNSSIAYFKNLYKLNKNDEINLWINNQNINFKVVEKYYIEKNGTLKLKKNQKDTLYLTTCDRFNKKRQLVLKCVNNV